MRLAASKPLFAWDELERSPSLAAIRETLAAIPDGPLLEALRQRRHNGCDKYPIHVLWGEWHEVKRNVSERMRLS
jgi:hypothetical protein